MDKGKFTQPMIVYNLGHPNRGWTDFPLTVDFKTEPPSNRENGTIQVELSSASFLTQLADLIDTYSQKVKRPLERFTYPMRILSEYSGDKKTRMILSPHESKGFLLDAIESFTSA